MYVYMRKHTRQAHLMTKTIKEQMKNVDKFYDEEHTLKETLEFLKSVSGIKYPSKSVISFKEMRDLQAIVRNLCENDGIYNQIDHLHRPDDNEVMEYVFNYLEQEIQLVIDRWQAIKKRILTFKNK